MTVLGRFGMSGTQSDIDVDPSDIDTDIDTDIDPYPVWRQIRDEASLYSTRPTSTPTSTSTRTQCGGGFGTRRRSTTTSGLYYNEKYDFYALSRFDDVREAFKNWRTYSSAQGTVLEIIKSGMGVPPGLMIFVGASARCTG